MEYLVEHLADSAALGGVILKPYLPSSGRGSPPPATSLFLDPSLGERRLVVLDDRGRMDAVTFRVE